MHLKKLKNNWWNKIFKYKKKLSILTKKIKNQKKKKAELDLYWTVIFKI